MKKKNFFKLCFIIISTFLYSINTNAIIFECENGNSYKINKKDNQVLYFFKKKNTKWLSIKNINVINDKIEFFIPDSTYLACNDKKLNVCKYKSLITYNISTKKANVREVVLDNCFIGTMGCNEYNKGLELNQRRCNIIE